MAEPNHRLNKDAEQRISKESIDALLSGDTSKMNEVLDQFEKLNAPPTPSANDLLTPRRQPTAPDDDRYTPPAAGTFSDANAPKALLDDDAEVPPPVEQTVSDPINAVLPQREDTVPLQREPVDARPAGDVTPQQSMPIDEFDDGPDEAVNPWQRFLVWINDDDTGVKKWGVIGGAIALVLLLIIGALAIGKQGDEPVAPSTPLSETAPTTSQAAQAPPAAATPGVLPPSSVQAQCPPEGSTNARSAFDNDPTTAWVCQRLFGIDGVVLTINFASPSTITKINVVPGFNYTAPRGESEWDKHRAVTRIEWSFGDGYDPVIQEIIPTPGESSIDIPTVTTSSVTARIMETAPTNAQAAQPQPGSPDDTFAVSNIDIIGTGAAAQTQ